MKQLFWLLILSAVVAFSGCSEDEMEQIEAADPSGANDSNTVNAIDKDTVTMYFPATGENTWTSINPTQIGWDTTFLNQAVAFAKDKNSYSLLILYKGRLLRENYFKGTDATSRHNIESVAKSMMALLIGMLQEQGKCNVNEPVSAYLSDGWSHADVEQEKIITVRDLLTMSSGLDDQLQYIGDPGTIWYYSQEGFNVLFKIVESVTGQPFAEVFQKQIFDPIGIHNYSWEGTDLSMNASDMARFGLLILNKANWNGTQLLADESYFETMLSPSQEIQKAYGYFWWLNGQSDYFDDKAPEPLVIDGPIYPAMPSDAKLAMGHHDQRIEIIASEDLVVVRQGGDTGLPELGAQSFDNQFWTFLMKAINRESAN